MFASKQPINWNAPWFGGMLESLVASDKRIADIN